MLTRYRDKWREYGPLLMAKIEENITRFNVEAEEPKVIDDSAPLASTPPRASSLTASKSPPIATTTTTVSGDVAENLKFIRELLALPIFSQSPPFTIQRLAELVQNPLQYHTHPVKYLRAVERCVNVSSSLDDYPVCETEHQREEKDPMEMSVMNGGVPLYSPIAWLTPESAPNAEVPQDEVLEQEQEMQITTPTGEESVQIHSPAAGIMPLDAVDVGPVE